MGKNKNQIPILSKTDMKFYMKSKQSQLNKIYSKKKITNNQYYNNNQNNLFLNINKDLI